MSPAQSHTIAIVSVVVLFKIVAVVAAVIPVGRPLSKMDCAISSFIAAVEDDNDDDEDDDDGEDYLVWYSILHTTPQI